jgi:hypothetical protein
MNGGETFFRKKVSPAPLSKKLWGHIHISANTGALSGIASQRVIAPVPYSSIPFFRDFWKGSVRGNLFAKRFPLTPSQKPWAYFHIGASIDALTSNRTAPIHHLTKKFIPVLFPKSS